MFSFRRHLVTITLLMLTIGCGSDDLTPDYRAGIENVILIAVDTLAAQNLGFMGYDRDTSPFIDELAGKSVVFDRAYTAKALTLPAFTSMFSGSHPDSHNVQGNGRNLPSDLDLLTGVIRERGFLTVGFPASHVISARYGINKGFTYYFPCPAYEIPASTVIQKTRTFLEGPRVENEPCYLDETDPLYMFIHFFDTHTDYNPSPAITGNFVDPSYDGIVDGTIGVFEQFNAYEIEFDEADYRRTRDLYDAEIRSFDDQLRDLFSLLERTGLYENSLIVFTADHGENLGEHHYITHGHPYEPGLHIPLFFHFPNDLGAGTRIDSLIEITDILPTILDLVGGEIPEGIDGHSLLPLIEDPSGESGGGRDYLLACGGLNDERKRTYSIFDGQYRLIKDIRWSEESLLYDVTVDPKETTDLAESEPAYVEVFEISIEYITQGVLPEEPVEYDPETEEMLRSLGYIH